MIDLCVSAALDAVKQRVKLPWVTVPSAPSDPITDSALKTGPKEGRVLTIANFERALKEITPSSSETLGTLSELRKWNEEFGEGRKNNKRRIQLWGKDRFGFSDPGGLPSQEGRVASDPPV